MFSTRTRTVLPLFLLVFFTLSCHSSGTDTRYEVIYSMDSRLTDPQKPDAAESYTIGMVPKATENSYFNQVEDGAREAAGDLGIEVIFEGPPVADTEQQIRAIRNLISRNVDMLAVSANDSSLLQPVLLEAASRNIRVITWDSDTVPKGRELFIDMVEPETLGRHLMDALALQMGEEGQFAILSGTAGASNMNEWVKWMIIQKEEYYPRMQLMETAATDDDPQKAYSEARRLIVKYPRLAGLIGCSSVATPAAAQAVIDAGKSGRVHTVGLSTPNLMREYLHAGSVQNVTLWSPKKLGYLTIVLAKNLLDGVLPVNGQNIRNVGEIRVEGDTVIMGEPLDFTKTNVDEYAF
ncbi:Autoinducer 2-binding protein LsrB precursor [compost metagenome]